MQALGLKAEKEEIQKMIPVAGKIDFGDFLRVMTLKMVSVIQLLPVFLSMGRLCLTIHVITFGCQLLLKQQYPRNKFPLFSSV